MILLSEKVRAHLSTKAKPSKKKKAKVASKDTNEVIEPNRSLTFL